MAILKITIPREVEGVTAEDLAMAIERRLSEGLLTLADGRSVVLKNVSVSAQDPATPEEIEEAREAYANGSDDDIEIDDNAVTSRADRDEGLWVSAWVWLSRQGSVIITEDRIAKQINVLQWGALAASFPYDDAPGARDVARSEAELEAQALIEGVGSGARVYDDTE
jgi:hypothetical protein